MDVAKGISTLSTPIPALPITLRLSEAWRTFSVTFVDERIARPSYWSIIFIRSSRSSPVITSTSIPRSRKIFSALGLNLSDIKTLGIIAPIFQLSH